MDYEDMIKDDPKPVDGEAEPEIVGEADVETIEPRAKSPWKAFILTGFLAGLIGAVGGGFGAYAALKKFSPAPVVQPVVDLSPIEARLNTLTTRVAAAETEVKTFSDRPDVEAAPVEPVDLSGLEDRLSALETAPSPEIDPEALTALKAAQEDGFEWPETEQIEAVLTQLDERLTKFESKQETDVESETADNADADDKEASEDSVVTLNEQTRASLQDLYERVATLEAGPVEIKAISERLTALENRPAPKPVVERVSILAFPKAQMIAAVEANMDGGILKKTFSRHVRVKDTDDPLTLIDGIESDLSAGRLAPAAEKFERLPSPVRSKGQAWYDSVKASL